MAVRPGRQASRSAQRLGRIRLAPLRPIESLQLDREQMAVPQSGGMVVQAPPYLPYGEWLDSFAWRQGEHMTLAGGTGSGKTTFARNLLPRRRYVAVMATKVKDPSLYDPLVESGFKIVKKWDPEWVEGEDGRPTVADPWVIFQPPLVGGVAGKDAQAEAFRGALVDIFDEGNWCVYCDEVRYLTDFLGCKAEMELLWQQGRSLGVSVVAATQRPVSIPILAFEAQHLFVWRFSHKPDIDTISHFTGTLSPVVRQTVPRLPKHEVLHVQPEYGTAERTKLPEGLT